MDIVLKKVHFNIGKRSFETNGVEDVLFVMEQGLFWMMIK